MRHLKINERIFNMAPVPAVKCHSVRILCVNFFIGNLNDLQYWLSSSSYYSDYLYYCFNIDFDVIFVLLSSVRCSFISIQTVLKWRSCRTSIEKFQINVERCIRCRWVIVSETRGSPVRFALSGVKWLFSTPFTHFAIFISHCRYFYRRLYSRGVYFS